VGVGELASWPQNRAAAVDSCPQVMMLLMLLMRRLTCLCRMLVFVALLWQLRGLLFVFL
jgi:hypothetical protein